MTMTIMITTMITMTMTITTNVVLSYYLGPNLISNGDFESSLTGPWVKAANHSGSSIVGSPVANGSGSLHVVASTGGTTGTSGITHTNVTGLTNGHRCVLSFNFDYGLNQIWQTLRKGATLYLHDLALPNDLFAMLAKERITAVPVMLLLPVTGAAIPSLTLVAIVKAPLKFKAGVNTTPASSVFTLATAPPADHTPVISGKRLKAAGKTLPAALADCKCVIE